MERVVLKRDMIAKRLPHMAPHIRPLVLACRDFGCGFLIVAQSDEPFTIPGDRPTICLIGDDFDCALGPSAFHAESIKKIIRDSLSGAIISCEPIEQIYQDAATTAVLLNSNSVIVETRLEREQEWIEFLQAANPKLPNIVATVAPMGRA